MVAKRKIEKIEKIEDAEVIVSKEARDDENLAMEKVTKLGTQQTLLLALFFIIIVIMFGILFHNEYNRSEEITNIQQELKTLTPRVTSEYINTELDERDLEAQKQTIILIDQAVKNLEKVFVGKFKSATDMGDNSKIIKLFKDDLLNLQLQFDKKILETKKISNKMNKAFLSDEKGAIRIQTLLDNLDLSTKQEFDSLSRRLDQIEKEFSYISKRLLDIELLTIKKTNKNLSVNLETFRELEESFVKTAYTALKMEAKRNIGGNIWSKFVLTGKSIFVFRSTEPKAGNSLDAILSRAEHLLSVRNFEGCLNELDTLDAVSLELFSEWVEKITLLSNKTN
jgi:hypothetical protein